MQPNRKVNLPTYLMSNPHLLVIIIVTILVAGFSAFRTMPRLEDPIITNRNPLIITLLPGASAERVEAQVSEKIEDALEEIPEIKDVSTTSRANISLVAVELTDSITKDTNREVFSRIRDKLDDAAQTFPPEALEPVFDEERSAVAFTLITGLSWDGASGTPLSILNRQAENLADALRNIPGTDLVRIYGNIEEQILVEIDPERMSALGLTVSGIATTLQNADVKIPAGALNGSDRDFLVEVEGELNSVARIGEVPIIAGANNSVVRLSDIASVKKAAQDPPSEVSISNGNRTVYVAARVQENRRVDTWSANALQTVETFKSTLGASTAVDIIFDQNEYTSSRLTELGVNLFLGAIVVFLVVFFFMGWRASWIVGSALPLTAAMTLFVVSLLGGKLHQMSIFGMIIALGLLIDNAIVVTDEIRKNMKTGLSPRAAVSKTLSHLFIPLLSSTLTTIFAFAPILLLPGNAGDFVGSIGGSVIIALACSFFVAMTIIATFTGFFGRSNQSDDSEANWLTNGITTPRLSNRFANLLRKAFRFPKITIGAMLIVPLTGFILASTLGSQFFPRTDRDMFQLRMWLPTATSIEKTKSITRDIENLIRTHDAITDVHWIHGSSFPSVYYNLVMNKDGSSNYAQGIIEATDFKAVKRLIPIIQTQVDEQFPEAQVVVTQFAQGPPSEADVEFRLVGPDIQTLQNYGETIRLFMAEHPSILHTQVSMERGEPKLWFKANEEETNVAGLRLASLAQQLQGNLQGFRGGEVLEDIVEMPVRVRFANMNRRDFDDLASTRFTATNQPGSWIPLSTLGEIELRPSSGAITRYNGERTNTIRGYTRNDALPIEVTLAVQEKLEASGFTLPDGYKLQVGGDSENQSEAVGNLTIYLPILSLLTVSILILSFRSVKIAIILGVAAFLSTGFGLLATWFAGLPLSFNTILGSLGLVGLAFNSSIVVLASIRSKERARAGDPDAIATQVLGSSRHLISTTLTTIGSFIPLLVFIGGDFWPPLAVVLAGGVGGSTLLAMVFTPAAYRILMGLKQEPSFAHAQ